MKRLRRLAPLLAALLLLGACNGLGDLYVRADRDTYDVVAPDYVRYLEADPTLTPDQIDRRVRTLEAWRLRIESAER